MLSAIPHDEVSIGRLPWVTWSLAAVGSVAALATLLGLDVESAGLGLDPGALAPLGFATHWLFSATAVQWLASTLLLLALGPHLEEAWGVPVYAGFLLGALAFSAGVYAFAGPSGRPFVGIAGAIAALTVALLVRHGFANVQSYLLLGPRDSLRLSFEAPAWTALIAWFAGEVLMSVATTGMGPTRGLATTVAFPGALFGAGAAWAIRQWNLEGRRRPAEERTHPVLAAAQAARDSGRPSAAVTLLEPAVRQRPHDPELVRALCDAACAAGEANRASGALRRLVVEQVRSGQASTAAGFWRAFGTSVPDVRLDPRTSVDLASALAAAGDKTLAARVLRDALEASPRVTPGVALRIVEVAAPLHRETAIRAARIALGAEGMDEAKRRKLEARVAELESGKSRDPQLDLAAGDRAIDVELDENYAPLRRPVETAPAEAVEAAFELSADGSLVTGASLELAERLPDTEPILLDANDPGFDPDSLRLDPDAPPLAEELSEASEPAAASAGDPVPDEDPNGATLAPQRVQAATPATPAPAEAPPDASPGDSLSGLGISIAADGARFHDLKCVEAVPLAIDGTGISLRGGSRVELARVDGIAVAAVHGMSARPVILIDLLLNWTEISDAPLRTVRLRSDQFDPRSLFPDAPGPLDAFRALLDALLSGAGATPLPDPDAARGRPFRMFPDLARYEREVLQVER
jgi:membrane associated rhomboid family serine protease